MTQIEQPDEIVAADGIRYDFTGRELRVYLGQIREKKIPCPICQTDKWGTLEQHFPDGSYKVLPDSITAQEFATADDLAAREDKCAGGNYNFICGNCGFCLSFNALFVATKLHTENKKDDKEKQ